MTPEELEQMVNSYVRRLVANGADHGIDDGGHVGTTQRIAAEAYIAGFLACEKHMLEHGTYLKHGNGDVGKKPYAFSKVDGALARLEEDK